MADEAGLPGLHFFQLAMTDQCDEIFDLRRGKAERLRSRGIDPYPARFKRTHLSSAVLSEFRDEGPPLHATVAGRIGVLRNLGNMAFAHLQDSGGRIQAQFRRDVLGDERYDLLELLDHGDFVGVSGEVFRTKRGEVTVRAEEVVPLAKALRNPPEKWHGLTDVEKRYRQRYLDLTANRETMAVFLARSKLVYRLRRHLVEAGFVEVETPVLQAVPGGGAARPFETYYNALDRTEYLRIALELFLKRCVIGGLERVFEIGRVFRNEGLSAKHNPEFTMLELYEAYADYHDMMRLTEELIAGLAKDVRGATRVPWNGAEIEFKPPWRRLSLREAILEHSGVDVEQNRQAAGLYQAASAAGLRAEPAWNRAKLVDELLSQFVEPKLVQPTFLLDYPVELSPLAKRRPDRPDLVERFEAFAGGMEIANAFTELNDPLDQRARFEEQARRRALGDQEAQPFDAEFLEALEHGMPPTGGLGMGVDRLAMLFTDQRAIRDVILFPQLRTPPRAVAARKPAD
jgi:lysyl-tRNA synthetase class 2